MVYYSSIILITETYSNIIITTDHFSFFSCRNDFFCFLVTEKWLTSETSLCMASSGSFAVHWNLSAIQKTPSVNFKSKLSSSHHYRIANRDKTFSPRPNAPVFGRANPQILLEKGNLWHDQSWTGYWRVYWKESHNVDSLTWSENFHAYGSVFRTWTFDRDQAMSTPNRNMVDKYQAFWCSDSASVFSLALLILR